MIAEAKEIAEHLSTIPRFWDAKSAVLEMKEGGSRQWRQMEWIGFYFEFLCERLLVEVMDIPGPKYGNARFDAFKKVPWDFKAHAMNTSSHTIIVNDTEAIQHAIDDYGAVGVILGLGQVEYNDEDRVFQKWHNELKGGKSKYEVERIERGAWSRLRKQSLKLEQISFVKITRATLTRTGSFQKDFRNADGSPRRSKVKIDLEKVGSDLIHYIDFA